MSVIKPKIDYMKNGPYDEFITPEVAVRMMLPYIPKHVTTIWECTAVEGSNIVNVLRSSGYNVIPTHINKGYDFFSYQPEKFDILVTNPAYSLKDKFLMRAFEIGRPFMFLLPVSAIAGKNRHKMFREKRIQLLIPDTRFNFIPDKKSSSWFDTIWVTYGLELANDLNYIVVGNAEKIPASQSENSKSKVELSDKFRKVA
jgi:hypothetical protein